MVDIIINEKVEQMNASTNNEEILVLLKEINSNLMILNDSVKELTVEVKSNRLENLNNTQQQVESITDAINSMIANEKAEETKVSEVSGVSNRGRRRSNEPYEPSKNLRSDWSTLILLDDGSIVNKSRRTFKLPVGLNELLYLIELDKNITMTYTDARELMKKFKIKTGTFGKLIYNLRYTDNFNRVLSKYSNNLKNANFSVGNDDCVLINGKTTHIPLNLVREWILSLWNTNSKQDLILKLQSKYDEYDAYCIRIICDSYQNQELNNLLKIENKKINFIENNPSKRKDLISASNGLI